MNKATFALILASVFLSSLAQIILKGGMSSNAVLESLAGGFRWAAIGSVAATPLVWIGLGIYFASALIWLLVLARVDVSLAYPFVGLGFIMTMILGWMIHGDVLNPARIVGTLLITAGVAVLGRG